MAEAVSQLQKLLASLAPLLGSLKKYEGTFSAEAKQFLQVAVKAVDSGQALCNSWTPPSGITGYLLSVDKLDALKACLTSVQQSLASMLAGSVPLPRSSKEELGNLKTELMALKIDLPTEQQHDVQQLRKLYGEAMGNKEDVDVIEARVDDVVRHVLQVVHSGSSLPEQDLKQELDVLEQQIATAKSSGAEADAAMLSLVLNSLQRLHASQLKMEESEEEPDEDMDDDDEDPFFMPMMPAVLKMAEASKFTMLARPLGPEQPKPFMIAMDAEPMSPSSNVSEMSTARAEPPAEHDSPGLTEKDFEPLSPEAQEAAAAATAALAATSIADGHVSPVPSPTPAAAAAAQQLPLEQAAVAGAAAVDAGAGTAPVTAGGAAEAGASGEAVVPAAGAAAPGDAANAPAAANGVQHEEKLKQFMNFLQGDNPGACMFHAQMRLSLDGCRKLSNFLKSSARVRALSLSHNFLGDDGMAIICEGLRVNHSVTALDLPDNNISDVGVITLTNAVRTNPSLTQLQLAYNRIGDEGARALADLIVTSQSLKKLGLSYNNIGKAGCQALTSAISSNQSLKHLQLLPGNPVEEKDAKALAKALKRNKKFSIRAFLGILD
mmetsp:Transcript_38183/g.85097  ORF Transcript_38183/g.85097 Transcript_38183/m.85097 type:complete len:606 (+) Transcript_38183:167-1984(+)|eukprot:CAMPEP_0202903792 /NCGR_PEP_ID=MMETSP1392-20130828/26383_1 /ASSEMBLY_ACC=CAM_ASM_000868 /TAXON_ID=225041 /ORGANISM="Chlamydomonas chlamydogama, Strain SAG 11-48b" /LENGTH=605 /DNA_ID=CAMNT_0049591125 /DNA_START=108 /DNA_END=1925 /DNA_ORIENTATION=+